MNRFLNSAWTTLRAARGWRRRGFAFAAGLSAAFAQAPFYGLPFLAIGFSALILMLDGVATAPRPRRSAFAVGWFFGLGYFLLGIYWMALSFLVQAEQFAWMAPFAALGMPSFLGLFYGAAAAIAVSFWVPGPRRVLIFAGVFVLFEYLRGHIMTGLPWNLAGQALAGSAVGVQSAAWVGVYGLSLIVVLLCCLPAAFIGAPDQPVRHLLRRGAILSALGFLVLYGVGFLRLSVVDPGDHDDVVVRIVQPNIPQQEKIDPSYWGRNIGRALDISSQPGIHTAPTTSRLFVIWPENTAPLIDEAPMALDTIDQQLPDRSILLTGAVRRQVDENGVTRFHNAMPILTRTPDGMRPIAYYDKHHLVPFGEYLPLRGLLEAVGLAQLAPYDDGFTPGSGPRTYTVGGPAFAPLICYETIFPGRLYPKGQRPEWLVTITNDAWFGDSSGPRQHLDQARLRSVESGLPMARAANTGVSALIDAAGRYRGTIGLYETGKIDAPLPKSIPPTLYAQLGDVLFFLMLGGVLAGGIYLRW